MSGPNLVCTLSCSAAACVVCRRAVKPPALRPQTMIRVGFTPGQLKAACLHSVTGAVVEDPIYNVAVVKPTAYCAACCPVCHPKLVPATGPMPAPAGGAGAQM